MKQPEATEYIGDHAAQFELAKRILKRDFPQIDARHHFYVCSSGFAMENGRFHYNKFMAGDLLQTKLYVPQLRPSLVPRPRLIEKLNDGLGGKLTLISAPAGFGKTTLVSAWVQQIEQTAAWLGLDESDNDPTRFLTYFVAALNQIQGIESDIGKGVLVMLQSPQPPPTTTVLTMLINEIAALPSIITLILDDYHLIEAQPIHDALTFLLEHLPPQMHLVIATRDDPHLPLARLRARSQLTELRAADLRFSSSETAEFLNRVMGLNLGENDIVELETRTEGWIAGLQLAAISMQGRKDVATLIKSFTGSHRFVLDYLIEEVLDQQSENVQTFLLKTAVLNRLTSSLCDTVTGMENGQAILEMLERSNLFIVPLDEKRRWYRYHHLFADLLRQRLHQTQPKQLSILHRRASEWYEQNGFVDNAIDHALRGEYYERAAHLIEDQLGEDLIDKYERGDQAVLRRWLAELPEEFVFSKPHLCILHAWNLFTSGQLDAANRSLQVAEEMLDPNTEQELDPSLDKNQLSDTNRMKLVGMIAAIRSFIVSYSGNIPTTIQYARQALEVLPEQERLWRSIVLITLGDAYANQGQMAAAHKVRSDALAIGKASGDTFVLMILNLRLAEILRQVGKLQQVVDICESQLKRADESGISEAAIVGWLLGIWGEALAELNHLDKAIDLAKKGVKLATLGKDVMHIGSSTLCLVRVLFSSGDLTGAEYAIQSLEKTVHEYDVPLWASAQMSAWQARIWLVQGKLEIASQWVGERELDPDGEPVYLHEMEYILFARILIAQGRLDEATKLLQRLHEAAKAGRRTSRVIEILILQTLSAQAGGDAVQAMTTLEQALTLAEAGGFIRIFVDEGPPMARLLYEALSRGIRPDYVRRLLAAFPVTEPKQAALLQTETTKYELIEPLSKREIEILQLIAEGLTNPKIASRLYLSPNTVKVHTHNIYGKLGVNNRTQAVMKARALGMLPTD